MNKEPERAPMDLDIGDILDGWPFEPGQLNVRLIEGREGEPKLQVRLDLGLLQLFVDGRPDGQRPEGFDSLLEYHEARLDATDGPDDPDDDDDDVALGGADTGVFEDRPGRETPASHRPDADSPDGGPPISRPENSDRDADEDAPDDGGQTEPDDDAGLSSEDCKLLRDEAMQYYHRSVALLALEDFEGVVRDASRNLRLMDLLHTRGPTPEDRVGMEPHRGHTIALRARALASMALKDGENKAALLALGQGLEELRAWHARVGDSDGFEGSKEAEMLRAMRDALVPKLPISQKAELKRRLDAAIAAENYELAAILRDELRLLPDEPKRPKGT